MTRYTHEDLRAWLRTHKIAGAGGGNKAEQMAQQNQQYAMQTGGALTEQQKETADHYRQLGMNYGNQADTAYADFLAPGGGGYTPEQAAAIQDKAGLAGLRTSATDLQSNYLTPEEQQAAYLSDQERQGVLGDQSGIRAGEAQVNAAVDPASVADFTARTRMTPEQHQAMITAGARDAAVVGQSAMEHNREAALAAGMDPMGVAGYTAQADRRSAIDVANAAANARVTADQVSAQREQGILGAEQNLQQQRANAAGVTLQTEQAMEAQASQRNAGLAANRQATSTQLAGNRQAINQGNQATQFNQGQYVEGQGAGRAAGVADTQRSDVQAGRNYLTGQEQTDINAAGQAENTTAGLFGATNSGANQAASVQQQAQAQPKWWQSLLSAGAQVAGGAAGGAAVTKYSDVRLKENIEPLATVGGVNLYRYTLKGDPTPRIGVIAQELHHIHPEAVEVGDDGTTGAVIKPWMVRYDKLAPHLAAHLG